MDDTRILIEHSKQLIATAREVIADSRRARAVARAIAVRSEHLMDSVEEAAKARVPVKKSR